MAKRKLPKFAKRHYEAIAQAMQEAMRYAQGYDNDLCPGGVQCAIDELADLFAKDNGQFDRERFIRACVPGANVRARTSNGPALPSNQWGQC
jgi:hypothetical protein